MNIFHGVVNCLCARLWPKLIDCTYCCTHTGFSRCSANGYDAWQAVHIWYKRMLKIWNDVCHVHDTCMRMCVWVCLTCLLFCWTEWGRELGVNVGWCLLRKRDTHHLHRTFNVCSKAGPGKDHHFQSLVFHTFMTHLACNATSYQFLNMEYAQDMTMVSLCRLGNNRFNVLLPSLNSCPEFKCSHLLIAMQQTSGRKPPLHARLNVRKYTPLCAPNWYHSRYLLYVYTYMYIYVYVYVCLQV